MVRLSFCLKNNIKSNYYDLVFFILLKEYLLRLRRGYVKQQTWRILRRYNDFVDLQKCLSIAGIDLPFPGKRFFGNMRPEFIAERRQALQLYINTLLMNPILASSLPAKRFVDPDSYSQSFHGIH